MGRLRASPQALWPLVTDTNRRQGMRWQGMRNNYGYTKTLAEAALARGVRFVYASSAAT